MGYLAKNNAYSTLAGALTNVALTLQVQTGHGDRFPVVAGADYTLITLEDAAGNREIIKVSARAAASDTLTIPTGGRGQEGTTARSWAANTTVVECRPTADLVQTAMGHPSVTTGAHAASAISVTPTGNVASTNVQAAIAELDTEKADAAVTAASLALKAPLASPAFTGVPSAPTNATASDASTQLATDAFVQNAIKAAAVTGLSTYTANATLPATDVRKLVYFNHATTQGTLTLPATAGLVVGDVVNIYNLNNAICIVSRNGTQTIYAKGMLGQTVLKLPQGASISLVFDGTNWIQVNSVTSRVTIDAGSISGAVSKAISVPQGFDEYTLELSAVSCSGNTGINININNSTSYLGGTQNNATGYIWPTSSIQIPVATSAWTGYGYINFKRISATGGGVWLVSILTNRTDAGLSITGSGVASQTIITEISTITLSSQDGTSTIDAGTAVVICGG